MTLGGKRLSRAPTSKMAFVGPAAAATVSQPPYVPTTATAYVALPCSSHTPETSLPSYTPPTGIVTYAEAPTASMYAANGRDAYLPRTTEYEQIASYVPPKTVVPAALTPPPPSSVVPVAHAHERVCVAPATSSMPSYVPPVMPSYVPPVDALMLPGPPRSLTQGMPTPEAVGRQKEEFEASLDSQLQQCTADLEVQKAGQLRVARQKAEEEKRRAANQIDQQLVQTESRIQQYFSQQLLNLQQAGLEQKARLEQQAMELQMDYKQRKAQEEMQQSQYALQRQHFEETQKLVAECQRLQPPAAPGAWGTAAAAPACAPPAVRGAPGAAPAAAPSFAAPAVYAGISQDVLPTTVVVPTYATAAAYSTAYSMAPTATTGYAATR